MRASVATRNASSRWRDEGELQRILALNCPDTRSRVSSSCRAPAVPGGHSETTTALATYASMPATSTQKARPDHIAKLWTLLIPQASSALQSARPNPNGWNTPRQGNRRGTGACVTKRTNVVATMISRTSADSKSVGTPGNPTENMRKQSSEIPFEYSDDG